MRLRQIWSRNRLENHSATKGKKSQTSRKSCHRKKGRRLFRVLPPIFGCAGQQVTRVDIVNEKLWIMKGTLKLSWPYVSLLCILSRRNIWGHQLSAQNEKNWAMHNWPSFFCLRFAVLQMQLWKWGSRVSWAEMINAATGFRRWCRDGDPAYSRRRNNIYCFTRATKFIAFLARWYELLAKEPGKNSPTQTKAKELLPTSETSRLVLCRWINQLVHN